MSSQNTMIRLYCIFNARPRDAYMRQLTRPLFAPKLTVNWTLTVTGEFPTQRASNAENISI